MLGKKSVRVPQMKSMFKDTRHKKNYVKYINANMTRNQDKRIEDWISPTTKTSKEQTTCKTRHRFFIDLPL